MIISKEQRKRFEQIQRENETLFPEFYGKTVKRQPTTEEIVDADIRFDIWFLCIVLAIFAFAFIAG